MSSSTVLKDKSKIKIKEPKKYKVIMHNDDFTPMDFVTYILENIFNKSEQDAFNIMMSVHNNGKAVVGIYSYDMAKTKTELAMGIAREEGFPFKITVEEE